MSLYLLDLADVLRAAGLDVVEVAGWQSRGSKGGLDSLAGGIVHHTATPATAVGELPTLRVLIQGRSDVPGPLCNLALGRRGTWYVIAAGRANHAGVVSDTRYNSSRSLGIEAEHPGDATPWPAPQYDSYVRGCAALTRAYGIAWRGHKEVAYPRGRKIDPTFDMDAFRVSVAAAHPRPKLPTITKRKKKHMDPIYLITAPSQGALLINLARVANLTPLLKGDEGSAVGKVLRAGDERVVGLTDSEFSSMVELMHRAS